MKAVAMFLLLGINIMPCLAQSYRMCVNEKNVVYLGIDNPIKIVRDDSLSNDVFITSNKGNIISICNDDFSYRPDDLGNAVIKICKINPNKDTTVVASQQVKVLEMPKPVFSIRGEKDGQVDLKILKSTNFIFLYFYNFDIHIESLIFSILVLRDGKVFSINENITHKRRDIYKDLKEGDKIIFYNIYACYSEYKNVRLHSVDIDIL